ncbi:MAG: tRNA (adenosine(37)-N6)-threonylcarbamoyltransferase complex dimerization subunit type 1 TsaB [Proteobacteria bacterium]|nr:tRNA (adenosine(37)-N6)-threonylcarbamoyltransferase complex dimerization subunit type 1 TsaB [Pseudomonadota bacterium]
MRLLALDTATEACSAALLVDGALATREAIIGRGHAEQILPMIDALLAEAGIGLAALDAIAFGRGPGAFTGVRIAVGIAQGLAYGAGLPTVPVSDLAALGAQALARATREALPATEALVALDARMGEVYAARVRPDPLLGVTLTEERLAPPTAVFLLPAGEGTARVAAGHGFSAYPELASRMAPLVGAVWPELLPRAAEVATLGAQALRAGRIVPPEAAEPVYLRDDVADRSSRAGR